MGHYFVIRLPNNKMHRILAENSTAAAKKAAAFLCKTNVCSGVKIALRQVNNNALHFYWGWVSNGKVVVEKCKLCADQKLSAKKRLSGK